MIRMLCRLLKDSLLLGNFQNVINSYSVQPNKGLPKEIIKEVVSQLALALDQGAIKFLEIKDGDKVLYEDSNDEPFED